MNIIAVDDERPVLRRLEKAIQGAVPNCSLNSFMTAKDALEYAKKTTIDVAFLDIEMAGMDGLTLAKNLKDIYGKTNIVFVTGYSEYALDALAMAASGYILKPVEPEAILIEINRLRDPVTPKSEQTERLRINCFGNFTVFVKGKPLNMTREKPRELLAYLVHKRGSFARSAEIAAALWEDAANNANMRQVKSRMMKILKDDGIDDIIISDRDSMAIDVKKISCDYYDFLKRKADGVNAYTGEYLSEYSWAEFTIGYLDNQVK